MASLLLHSSQTLLATQIAAFLSLLATSLIHGDNLTHRATCGACFFLLHTNTDWCLLQCHQSPNLFPAPTPQITVFASLLALDTQRVSQRRLDLCPFITLPPSRRTPRSRSSPARSYGGQDPYTEDEAPPNSGSDAAAGFRIAGRHGSSPLPSPGPASGGPTGVGGGLDGGLGGGGSELPLDGEDWEEGAGVPRLAPLVPPVAEATSLEAVLQVSHLW